MDTQPELDMAQHQQNSSETQLEIFRDLRRDAGPGPVGTLLDREVGRLEKALDAMKRESKAS